jgi:hypothetical protein
MAHRPEPLRQRLLQLGQERELLNQHFFEEFLRLLGQVAVRLEPEAIGLQCCKAAALFLGFALLVLESIAPLIRERGLHQSAG